MIAEKIRDAVSYEIFKVLGFSGSDLLDKISDEELMSGDWCALGTVDVNTQHCGVFANLMQSMTCKMQFGIHRSTQVGHLEFDFKYEHTEECGFGFNGLTLRRKLPLMSS